MLSVKKVWLLLFLLIAVTGLLLRIGFFFVSVNHLPPTSDECLPLLTALDIRQGHFPLLVMANTYQFPVEAYLTTPLASLLPRTALGVRLLPFLLQTGAWLLMLATVFRMGLPVSRWPILLLLCIPSAYVLMLQSAYPIVEHSSFAFLSALTIFLAVHISKRDAPQVGLSGLAGFVGGLAFSNHMLALPVTVAAALSIGLGQQSARPSIPRPCHALLRIPALVVGLLMGVLPYWLAKKFVPGAYADVVGTLPWRAALKKLWSPGLTDTLPCALGTTPTLFPDLRETMEFLVGLRPVFTGLFVVILSIWTVLCLVNFIRRSVEKRWPTIEPDDLFPAMAWIGLALFAFSTRSHIHTFRYLLPVLWCFPFILGGLYAGTRWRGLKWAVGIVACGWALLNVAASVNLIRCWKTDDVIARAAKVYDLTLVMEQLKQSDIRHCYASYWAAYRIQFHGAGRLVCSQPYNERFAGRPAPGKSEVDAASRVAYVLADGLSFPPERLERDLATMQTTADMEKCGDFRMYSDFKAPARINEQPLHRDHVSVSTSVNPDEASSLADGNRRTRWRSRTPQKAGMGIDLVFPKTRRICRADLFYDSYPHDRAKTRTFSVLQKDVWSSVATQVPAHMDSFEWKNGHPVYGSLVQVVRFEPCLADALRVEIAEPNQGRNWSIGEIELYESL